MAAARQLSLATLVAKAKTLQRLVAAGRAALGGNEGDRLLTDAIEADLARAYAEIGRMGENRGGGRDEADGWRTVLLTGGQAFDRYSCRAP